MRWHGMKAAGKACSPRNLTRSVSGWAFLFNTLRNRLVRKSFMVGFERRDQSKMLTISVVYIISLYQSLGLTGGVPLILGAAYVTVATISNFIGALLLDKVGRKPLLSKSALSCVTDPS